MSAFTDVAAEAVLLAGGGRAILLQIADPAVGAGVARHSDFANRPLDRFAKTVTYAYATVFGTAEELAVVVNRVNEAHRPVHSHSASTSPIDRVADHEVADTGICAHAPDDEVTHDACGHEAQLEVAYDAFDREAQLWVAATLYHSAITVYEKVFGALGQGEAEEVYRRYGVLGTSLQVHAGSWPADRRAFTQYWNDAMSHLDVSDDARRVASDLLHPRTAPLWLRAAMPLVRLITAGLLTPELRRAFVLPWSTRHQRRFDRIFALTAVVYPRLPRRLRHLPKDHYLAALRQSVATERARSSAG
ncbi:MAG: hypothetical protein JWQ64_2416 [Subtercola sp.]|jgi:uncharacterized protein (DUF2236 family)|nr:hypothetical protein [Subtercola sp.]